MTEIPWKTYTENQKFSCFDESTEKDWNGNFYFVQTADIQFGLIQRYLENNPQPGWAKETALAELAVEKVNRMRPRPRFMVMCGDLCDAFPEQQPELREQQEKEFKRIFSKLHQDIPLVCVCGNHDVGDEPTAKSVQAYRNSFGDDYFTFWCGGIFFIVINSQFLWDSSKVQDIAQEHEEWLNCVLAEAKKNKVKRAMVFQHIPWFLYSPDENESNYFCLNLETRMKWMDKLREAGVQYTFCGHYHQNAGGAYKDLRVVTTSAMGGQLGKDSPGVRVVRVQERTVDHVYYSLENIPSVIQVDQPE
ncbi:serine/threonine-protein phosphatase CPPED1-like [Bacillus rossius redtenbacheri]|uniref:serine/threonine-protein phosphatase CPPED1-like n=1 Tax=Bacillus rossius redtenbacheri TaxID=93214 RepID=UPI002FDEBD6E